MALLQEYTIEADDDARMHEFAPDTEYGGQTTIGVGYTTAKFGDTIRSVLRLPTSGLPEGFRIQGNAKLRLYCTTAAASDEPIAIHEIGERPYGYPDVGWIENEVTWNDYKDSTAWLTPGGRFKATPIDTSTLPTATGDVDLFDSAALADHVAYCLSYSDPVNVLIKRTWENIPSVSAYFAANEHVTYSGVRLIVQGVVRTVHFVGGVQLVGKTTLAGG